MNFWFRFKCNLFGDTIEVRGWFAYIVFEEPVDLCHHYVESLVCEILSFKATTAGKKSDQAEPDLLVLNTSLVTIRIKPAQ